MYKIGPWAKLRECHCATNKAHLKYKNKSVENVIKRTQNYALICEVRSRSVSDFIMIDSNRNI